MPRTVALEWYPVEYIVARKVVITPPFFFRIVKDFTAIQIIENFKDDESNRELKNNVGILPHFRKKGQYSKGGNSNRVYSTK